MNKYRRPATGFTLVEMLVVIAIIGVLVALITPAVWRALLTARENRIVYEISNLEMSLENYRQQRGAYPPNGFLVPAAAQHPIATHVRRAFARHQDGPRALPSLPITPVDQLIAANLTAAESLVFWLAQVRNDPRRPISGLPEANDSFFDFAEDRLRHTRTITLGTRSVRLFEYVSTEGGVPYAYFAAPYVYVNDSGNPAVKHFPHEVNGIAQNLYPYQSSRPSDPATTDWAPNHQWINPTTYQLINGGLDGEYGADSRALVNEFKVFPDGYNFSTEDWDNIANFSNQKSFGKNTE